MQYFLLRLVMVIGKDNVLYLIGHHRLVRDYNK